MYDIVVDVQENNDVIIDAQKKNDASCKCMMQLQMYKKRIVAEGSCKAQVCSHQGTSSRCID